jgi:hypothetical protein
LPAASTTSTRTSETSWPSAEIVSEPASHETRSATAGPVVKIVVVAMALPVASYDVADALPGW